MDEPTPPVKRPLSEAELAARRANAQKSTGPTSDEGKNICRWNALQHGLRAELPVLPGECPEAYAHRLEEWMDDLGAQNDMQRFLVTRAVKASWKMERGDSVENGLIADSMVNIAAGAEEADLKETERLAARLKEDPSVIRQIRKTPAGCRFILSELSILEQRLSRSMGLLFSQRHMLMNLLGKRMSDVFRDDPVATRYVIAELSGVLGNQDVDPEKVAGVIGGGVPEGMSRTEYDQRIKFLAGSLTEKKEGNTKLKAYIAEVKTELTEHLKVIEELTEYKRAQAVRNARIDLGPQGKQLMQYQQKHEASFDSALRRLAALQKPQSPPPGPGRKPKKGKADAPTPESQAPIPTQAHVAVTTPAIGGLPVWARVVTASCALVGIGAGVSAGGDSAWLLFRFVPGPAGWRFCRAASRRSAEWNEFSCFVWYCMSCLPWRDSGRSGRSAPPAPARYSVSSSIDRKMLGRARP